MSMWTNVRGLLQVSVPGRTQKEKEYILDSVLRHLPVITGSEGPCYVHFIKGGGYNWSNNFDEFDNYSNLTPSNGFQCQDDYYIVLEGNLRDRYVEFTLKEVSRFLSRLSSRLFVCYCYVEVSGDTCTNIHTPCVFNNTEWMKSNYVSDKNNWTYGLTWHWVKDKDGKYTWNTLLGEEHALQSDS